MIVRVGADKNKPREAVCFEMSPGPAKKKLQLDFNRKLVAASSGMLAPVSGSERYLSVGCGRTAAFCRAVNGLCATPIAAIADHNGCIDMAKIIQDKEFADMLLNGWEWTVLPWACAEAWPTMADVSSALSTPRTLRGMQEQS